MIRFGMNVAGASIGPGTNTLPRWMYGASMAAYAMSFAACTLVFSHAMPLNYALFSIVSILLFFVGTKKTSVAWAKLNNKQFLKNVFTWALVIRLLWVVFSYFIYNEAVYGKPDGYGDDNGWYFIFCQIVVDWVHNGFNIPISELIEVHSSAIDDTGYPFWLAILYLLSFESSDIFVPMLFKALMSAYCCNCVYRVTQRHFGEGSARIAALFMCFNPYLLFWCSSMLKEAEMIFLCCVFIDQTDRVLSSRKKLTFRGLLPGMVAGLSLFLFRAPLAIVCFLSVLTHIVLASHKVMQSGKRVLMAFLVGVVMLVGIGDRLRVQSRELIEIVQSNQQKSNMEWRSNRTEAGGTKQSFAKYAGAAVFAPMIFTIPFPTFNMASEEQIMQLEMSGANYIKNILSFFVVLSFLVLLISGEWRRHVFILAYTVGYHLVLVMSSFAQSGRFHMPVWPMIMIFGAYGIQIAKTNTRVRMWFPIVLMIEIVACIAWNWFKLKGRGMI